MTGEKVRIGIQAPQKDPVFRKEIYLEIHREGGGERAVEDGHAEPRPAPQGGGAVGERDAS